jgi:hypothetical protein
MKRIDPGNAPQSFAAAQLKPLRWIGLFIDDECACIVGVHAALLGNRNNYSVAKVMVDDGFSSDYVAGLSGGWESDNDITGQNHNPESEEYKQGYIDGEEAWTACFNAKLVS